MIRLGYPTQNLTLPASTNRMCRLASVDAAEKVRALVWANLTGLETILRWNAERGVALFALGVQLGGDTGSVPGEIRKFREMWRSSTRWCSG